MNFSHRYSITLIFFTVPVLILQNCYGYCGKHRIYCSIIQLSLTMSLSKCNASVRELPHSQTWCVPDVLISCARTAVFLWTVALQWFLMSVRQIVSRLLLCHWPQLLPSTSEFISDLCWAKIYTYIYGTCYTRSWNYAVFYLLMCLVDDYVHCALLTYAYTNEMWVSRICNF